MTSAGVPLPNLSWNNDADTEQSLEALRQYVEAVAQRQLDWYSRAKKLKSVISRALRMAAIFLFALGGLVPILKAAAPQWAQSLPFDFGQTGYLAIALAASCLGLDRFFGFSSGWIRYITTALAIERSREEFRLEWVDLMAKGGEARTTKLIQASKTFLLAMFSQVEHETQAWVAEFQSNLAQLEKDLAQRASEVKARATTAGEP
jgi:low affinity Fe/Cu permease